MAEPKVQRSYYFTPEQAKWLKVEAAKRGVTSSALLGDLIEAERSPVAKVETKARSKGAHDILSRIAKQ